MGKKSRREAQQSEEARQALATTKAAEARAAKRALAAAKAKEAKGTPEPVEDAVVETADPIADVVTPVAEEVEEVEEQVAEPVDAPVRKPKKARFVRKQTENKPRTKDTPLPPRSTTAAGKMMSKNVTLTPKAVRPSGPKDERTTGPKPKA